MGILDGGGGLEMETRSISQGEQIQCGKTRVRKQNAERRVWVWRNLLIKKFSIEIMLYNAAMIANMSLELVVSVGLHIFSLFFP